MYNQAEVYAQDDWKVSIEADAQLRLAVDVSAAELRQVQADVELFPGHLQQGRCAAALHDRLRGTTSRAPATTGRR